MWGFTNAAIIAGVAVVAYALGQIVGTLESIAKSLMALSRREGR